MPWKLFPRITISAETISEEVTSEEDASVEEIETDEMETAGVEDSFRLGIEGVEVTALNGETKASEEKNSENRPEWTFTRTNEGENILTLDGATLHTASYEAGFVYQNTIASCIAVSGNLTLRVLGENVIEDAADVNFESVIVQNEGVLTIAEDTNGSVRYSDTKGYFLYEYGEGVSQFKMSGGKLTLNCENVATVLSTTDFLLEGGELVISNQNYDTTTGANGRGIFCDNLKITGGSLDIRVSGADAGNGYAVYAEESFLATGTPDLYLKGDEEAYAYKGNSYGEVFDLNGKKCPIKNTVIVEDGVLTKAYSPLVSLTISGQNIALPAEGSSTTGDGYILENKADEELDTLTLTGGTIGKIKVRGDLNLTVSGENTIYVDGNGTGSAIYGDSNDSLILTEATNGSLVVKKANNIYSCMLFDMDVKLNGSLTVDGSRCCDYIFYRDFEAGDTAFLDAKAYNSVFYSNSNDILVGGVQQELGKKREIIIQNGKVVWAATPLTELKVLGERIDVSKLTSIRYENQGEADSTWWVEKKDGECVLTINGISSASDNIAATVI